MGIPHFLCWVAKNFYSSMPDFSMIRIIQTRNKSTPRVFNLQGFYKSQIYLALSFEGSLFCCLGPRRCLFFKPGSYFVTQTSPELTLPPKLALNLKTSCSVSCEKSEPFPKIVYIRGEKSLGCKIINSFPGTLNFKNNQNR